MDTKKPPLPRLRFLPLALITTVMLLVGCLPPAAPTPAALHEGSTVEAPTPMPAATHTPAPDGDPGVPVLRWQREGGFAGFCDELVLFAGRVEAESCRSASDAEPLQGKLTPAQLELLRGWLARLRPVEYESRDQATADAMTIRISFSGSAAPAGQGAPNAVEATEADLGAMGQLAAEVFAAASRSSAASRSPADVTPLPVPVTPAASGGGAYPCASALERRELRKPHQTSVGRPRYTLAREELAGLFAEMGIEDICIPEELGAPFLNVDWDSATSAATTGRMISLGFEGLYPGAGWGDGYLVYATYDFATGSEYDTFAHSADRDALRRDDMPGIVEVNGTRGFVRYMPGLCYGTCNLFRTIVFPMDSAYVAVVSVLGDFEPTEGADSEALGRRLESEGYPAGARASTLALDWLARSIRFRPATAELP